MHAFLPRCFIAAIPDGITRRYVQRLIDPAVLSTALIEMLPKAGNPSNSRRLTELDLPLDWTNQRSLLTR
jgi:hypothetical protein